MASIFIQVLAYKIDQLVQIYVLSNNTKVCSPVPTTLQVGGKGFLLVILLPVLTTAVVIVGVHMMVMSIQP